MDTTALSYRYHRGKLQARSWLLGYCVDILFEIRYDASYSLNLMDIIKISGYSQCAMLPEFGYRYMMRIDASLCSTRLPVSIANTAELH